MADTLRIVCSKCDRRQFGLVHQPAEDFVLSQWTDNPVPYLIYRSFLALYTIIIVFYTGIVSVYGPKIFIWLTYWSYYVLTAGFLISAINTWIHFVHSRQRKRESSIPPHRSVLLMVQWVLINVAFSAAPLISILFWTVEFKGRGINFITFNTHGVNLILAVIDIFATRCPIRIHHFYFNVIYCCSYALFSVIYWAAGGTNHRQERFIYGVLDYQNNLGLALIFIFTVPLLAAPLSHFLMYALYRLRILLYSTYFDQDQPKSVEMETLSRESSPE